ncbi:hypothetical protein E4L95_01925 [Paracoccus liaowanqingii]|uniref:Phage tail assembly chaperone n=1 Tax=Paracoccus liaowanqingii TaxID=2560053 RepID=A0A4Z1CS83_9RHOB|nr:hypothetical protein [Paracoccus liaowanqingii]TGN68269.1 hypothetical protein E4L95_01925 [Paracoccus liaowanqingii]
MSLQPAFEIVLEAHGQTVTLRASLRAAVTLDAMPGGFPQVHNQISRLSYTAIRAVILATATDRQAAHRFLAASADMPLRESLPDAQAACLAVLASILPQPDEAAQSRATTAEAMPLRAYFQTLYEYATGWLGWTPAEAWAASTTEIEAAFAAHVDRLVKMTPGMSGDQSTRSASTTYTAERLREIDDLGHDPAFDRAAFAKFKARHRRHDLHPDPSMVI